MLGHCLAPSELGIASGDYVLHASDIFKDFSSQLRNGRTPGQSVRGRFAAGRKIPEPEDYTASPALTVLVDAHTGFPRRQASLAVFNRAAVGQIKVVQYFR